MIKDTNRASNATFKMLAAGMFLESTIVDVNGQVDIDNICNSAKDEIRSFRSVVGLFKNYLKGFTALRVESNRKTDAINAKAKKVVLAKLKRLNIEYSENQDLEEGYNQAAGDIWVFMDAWIRSSQSNNRAELMDFIKDFE